MKIGAFTVAIAVAFTSAAQVSAAPATSHEQMQPSSQFTGRITRNKVRLRLQPNLDCRIVRELDRGDLLAIVDEEADFYVVAPDPDDHAYVYHSYVADDQIQGSRVNVRLSPDLEAPVLTQLNSGDPAIGRPCPTSSKWMEIPVPESVTFYVAKEFIEPVGDANYLVRMREREKEAIQLIDSAWMQCQSELQKPYEKLKLDGPRSALASVAREYSDFPDQVERAKELLARTHQAETQKKVAYLEGKVRRSDKKGQVSRNSRKGSGKKKKSSEPVAKADTTPKTPVTASAPTPPTETAVATDSDLDKALADYHARLDKLEERLHTGGNATSAKGSPSTRFLQPDQTRGSSTTAASSRAATSRRISETVSGWQSVESTLFSRWAEGRELATESDFYSEQQMEAIRMRGKVTPYDRPVKNKPGDFVLVDPRDNRPLAYIYSTQVDLSTVTGKEITVVGAPRSNNNFAYPAYFALSIE